MDTSDLIIDLAHRTRDAVDALPRLSAQQANAHLGSHPNSIAWLLWHAGRQMDIQFNKATGAPEVWETDGFRERFRLGDIGDAMGYGHTPAEARRVVVQDAASLVAYPAAVLDHICGWARRADEEDWAVVVDYSWRPPVDRRGRVISLILDALQHVAQADYLTAVVEPADAGGGAR